MIIQGYAADTVCELGTLPASDSRILGLFSEGTLCLVLCLFAVKPLLEAYKREAHSEGSGETDSTSNVECFRAFFFSSLQMK